MSSAMKLALRRSISLSSVARFAAPTTAAGDKNATTSTAAHRQGSEKLVLYKARWLLPLRMLVRLKIIQLTAFGAIVVPVTQYASGGDLSFQTVASCGGVVFGATGASLALWYYSRRYIGELALLPPYPTRVQLSTIDFWGNRENLQFNIRQVVPPLKDLTRAELFRLAQLVLVPIDVVGHRQFVISLKHGHLIQKRALFALLDGTLESKKLEDLLDNYNDGSSNKDEEKPKPNEIKAASSAGL